MKRKERRFLVLKMILKLCTNHLFCIRRWIAWSCNVRLSSPLLILSTSCLFVAVFGERSIVYPCTDLKAIRWVRDKHRCDRYFICHYGQPLAMPACPLDQVWSDMALNCVPEDSRWNDCDPNFESQIVQTTTKITSPDLPNTVHMPRYSKSSPRVTVDFWGNTVIDLEPLTTEEPPFESKPTDSRDDVIYYIHENRGKTNPPIYLETEAQMTRITTGGRDTHNLREFMRTKQRRYPLYNSDRRDSVDKSRWYSSPNLQRTSDDHARETDDKLEARDDIMENDFISEDHPCRRQSEDLFSHPENCHWYYNCSGPNQREIYVGSPNTNSADTDNNAYRYTMPSIQHQQWKAVQELEPFIRMQPSPVRGDSGSFVWECRYPQLFDEVAGRCREFINVECHSRFEPVDQCEYTARQCPENSRDCVPCEQRLGRCRGRENGVYPLSGPHAWSPVFVTCYLQRNIARDECSPPTPVFSPEKLDCVSLFEVPKQHGGFQPDCTARADGYYPDEQGRCAIFFRCALGHFRGYDECPPGSVFDPTRLACETYSEGSRPCGEGQAPLCGGRMDGLFADPYGRCTHYFECRGGAFQQYFTCDLGIFDPLTHRCVVAVELTMRPCGLQPSPCEALPTGMYPDQATGCQHFIECHKGVILTNGTCTSGTVFSALTGRCDTPQLAPPPCGTSDICLGRPDGRYPAMVRGCSYYFDCQHGQFTSLRRCTVEEGGYFFNPASGQCDYPQNICPPCGYKWWGW